MNLFDLILAKPDTKSKTPRKKVQKRRLGFDCLEERIALSHDGFEPDNTPADAKLIATNGSPQSHSIHTGTDLDWVKFNLSSTSNVTIETDGVSGGDTEIRLFGPNSSTSQVPGGYDDDDGNGYYSKLVPADIGALGSGTYYVRVNEYQSNNAISNYTVRVTATMVSNGDGFEVDDTAGQAKVIATNGSPQSHSIHTGTDLDWVKFTLPSTSNVTIETDGVSGGDTEIRLYGPNSSTSQVPGGYDDDDGNGYYSKLVPADIGALGSGTYYVRVNEYQSNNAISSYTIRVTANAGVVTDGFDFAVGRPSAACYGVTGWGFKEWNGSVWHPGEDWNRGSGNDDLGDSVYAVANGTVVAAGDYGAGWGNIILVRHDLPDGGTVWSQYAHLQTIMVSFGTVLRGRQIGTVGRGYNDQYDAHLHFELRRVERAADAWVTGWSPSDIDASYYNPTAFINANRPIVPGNDSFDNRGVIRCSRGRYTGSNTNASREAGEPIIFGNAGARSVWWSFTATTTGSVTITTAGSTFDTLLGVYTGSSVSTLTRVTDNDDDPNGGLTSRVTFTAIAGTPYRIAVDGWNGAFGEIVLNML